NYFRQLSGSQGGSSGLIQGQGRGAGFHYGWEVIYYGDIGQGRSAVSRGVCSGEYHLVVSKLITAEAAAVEGQGDRTAVIVRAGIHIGGGEGGVSTLIQGQDQ